MHRVGVNLPEQVRHSLFSPPPVSDGFSREAKSENSQRAGNSLRSRTSPARGQTSSPPQCKSTPRRERESTRFVLWGRSRVHAKTAVHARVTKVVFLQDAELIVEASTRVMVHVLLNERDFKVSIGLSKSANQERRFLGGEPDRRDPRASRHRLSPSLPLHDRLRPKVLYLRERQRDFEGGVLRAHS